MNEGMKQELLKWGVDISGVLERFMGNEALVLKFMNKFLDDENYNRLGDCLMKEDAAEAFKCAHTLKGVAANLGLQALLTELEPLVESLRAGSLEGTREKYELVGEKYESLCGILRKYQ